MEFVNTFKYHRNNPQQSLHDYYRQLRIELSKLVKSKKRIYLDTKFWVLLRNGLTDPKRNVAECDLLHLSRQLVKSGLCVFPISEDVYLEVIRQTDPKTLLNTVKLIDELSLGISTLSHEECTQLELLYFWYSHTQRDSYAPMDLVWTKLSYTMGFNSFSIPVLSESENLVIQKAFIDQMWGYSLQEQIKVLLANGGLSNLPKPSVAHSLNLGKFQHMHEASSFKQMFLNEVAGWIDVHQDMLLNMMDHMFERVTGEAVGNSRSRKEIEETKRLTGNAIYNIFLADKMGLHLPSARILSGLHASVRWDKKQKFQDHDLHDFRHACAALPYFDYFFTEKRLAHMVTQKQLGFDRMFHCKVSSNIKKAIGALDHLLVAESG